MSIIEADTFRVTNKKLVIPITAMLNEYLGHVHDETHIANLIKQTKKSIVVAATVDDQLVGTAFGIKLGLESADEVDGWAYPDEAKVIDGYYGMLVSSVVLPECRGNGLGRTLAQWRIRYLTQLDCQEILAICWDNGTPQASLPLLTKMGFQVVDHVDTPWRNTPCPRCGSDCTCPATMVSLKVG